jgi:hypothetical protein
LLKALRALKEANHTQILKDTIRIRITLKKKFKDISKKSDIFIILDKTIHVKTLIKFLAEKYGAVFTAKISYAGEEFYREYGYVQFEKAEIAEKFIKDNEKLIRDMKNLEIEDAKILFACYLDNISESHFNILYSIYDELNFDVKMIEIKSFIIRKYMDDK